MNGEDEIDAYAIAMNATLVANLRRQGDHTLARIYEAEGLEMRAKYEAKIFAEAVAERINGSLKEETGNDR